MKPVVVIMTKAPRPGHVKTRLCPPLLATEAASLHEAFLRDTIDRVRALGQLDVAVAYTPPEDRDLVATACGDIALLPQSDGDLGARLATVFQAFLARDSRHVIVIGADIPTLPGAFVRRATVLLNRPGVDVVLGPAHDGGYYLVGMKRFHPTLFHEIPWSTERVYTVTMERAAEAGLRVASLPPWYDVDTPSDLTRVAAELHADGLDVPHTRAYLQRLGFVQ
jgi:rSAM/selenodomain-associated transferase 1